MEHPLIPKEELEVFKQLKDLKVIFDVGARTDIDYLELRPKAEFHLFEPNPEFFEELKRKIEDRKIDYNVYLNNFGLGEIEKIERYNTGIQAFKEGRAWADTGYAFELPIKTLDWYIKEKNIKQIDFLKIDTEGYDLKVLQGGIEAIKITRYIQFEHWDNIMDFWNLLSKDFWMKDVGFRNILCQRL